MSDKISVMPRALVLSAGLGTRLRPVTNSLSKGLVRIGETPLLDRWHRMLAAGGVREAMINAHAHARMIEQRCGLFNDTGEVAWQVAHEPRLLGTAATLMTHLPWLEAGDDFLVIYADNLSDVDIGAMVRFHRFARAQFTMALFRTARPEDCGIAVLDASGRVVHFEEKPSRSSSDLANAGIYVISRGFVARHGRSHDKDIAYDLLPRLTGLIHGWEIRGYHRDIGRPEDLAQAHRDLIAGKFDDIAPVCVLQQ
jgi:mannose-1-phosphate guanylyltransferase